MIVPCTRLLVWVAWVGVSLALMQITAPALASLWGALAFAFAALVIFDASRAWKALAGVSMRGEPVVRMQKGAECLFPVVFSNDSGAPGRFRIGVAFPSPLGVVQDECEVLLPAGVAGSRLSLPCVPDERGRYDVTVGVMEGYSPFGFWAGRKKVTLQSEVRVYPNLMDERRKVAALFLNRGRNGLHAQRSSGKGREFEKIRDYASGDPLQDIHWKASAKRRMPMTKVFQVERTQEVIVVLDASRLSLLQGPNGETVMERHITAALMLALATRQQGDHFGMVVFSDRLLRFVKPQSGKNHFQVCRDLLYAVEAKPVAPDFQELATMLRLRLRKRALLVFLTSLADPGTAEAFRASVPPLCRHHLTVVNMIRPPSVAPIFSEPVASETEIYDRLGGHLAWHDLQELQNELKREGITLSFFDHERMAADLVSQYLEIKARQIL